MLGLSTRCSTDHTRRNLHLPHSLSRLSRCLVTEGGAATKAGVRAGDIVVSLNGAGPLKYADLIAVIGTAGRPVSLGFTRPASGAGDVSGTSGVVSSHAGTNGARGSSVGEGPLRRMQDLARRRANEIGGNSWVSQVTSYGKRLTRLNPLGRERTWRISRNDILQDTKLPLWRA